MCMCVSLCISIAPDFIQLLVRRSLQAGPASRGGSTLFASLLGYVCAHGDAAAVLRLLDMGVQASARDWDGQTALHVAATR